MPKRKRTVFNPALIARKRNRQGSCETIEEKKKKYERERELNRIQHAERRDGQTEEEKSQEREINRIRDRS